MRLRDVALGTAIGECVNRVREVGGDNDGEKVREYLSNAGIPVPAPWCAAFIQWATDGAARYLSTDNPLDDVTREALVADYVSLAEERGWVIEAHEARGGDLVAFKFSGADRWNHIGFVEDAVPYVTQAGEIEYAPFRTVEGNTSPGVGESTEEEEREGDGVYRKTRRVRAGRTIFLRWDEMTSG